MPEIFSLENRAPPEKGDKGDPGSSGNAFTMATASSSLFDGAVVKRVSGGSCQTAAGNAAGNSTGVFGVAHPATLSGASANVYQNGSRCPVSGLGVGDVYRSTTGALVLYGALPVGGYSQKMGYSDNTGVDVLIGEEFPV